MSPESRPATSATPTPAQPRGKALVVDDESTTLLILQGLLRKEGFATVAASNGVQAIESFERESPTMVFVDVVMPGMNGFEVARHIKKRAGKRFVPILFLTAITDENTLAECIAAGGDDFLTKPISPILLRAKIMAAERITHLYETVQRQHHQLLFEQQLARQVYAKTLKDNTIEPGEMFILQRPASVFSGDLVLVEKSPSGALHVLLGDFTGHGLAAAIGALPAAEIFRSMTSRGYSPPEILSEINRKLRSFLPTGLFLAVVFVRLHQDGQAFSVCNCGLPEVMVVDGQTAKIKHRIPSLCLPLGITSRFNGVRMNPVEVNPGDRIIIATDGFVEAKNADGEFLGNERFQSLLENGEPEKIFERLVLGLDDFLGETPLDDDVTLVVLPCEGHKSMDTRNVLFSLPDGTDDQAAFLETGSGDWEWNTTVKSTLLKTIDLAPVLLRNLTDLLCIHDQRHALFTVISELLNNAIDHGLLGLDSRIKDSPEGFIRYFEERSNRLAALTEGSIHISFQGQAEAGHGWLRIRMEDSGEGFDHAHWQPPKTRHNLYGMRGLHLARGLCKHLTFEGRGNIVKAVYVW
ncbi:fused response regulator/phosphatase [Candidatus Woesearchaeota archaeon]|nr:fused response regulator/phosphatase [Candidatus Woesearchaeota archaeon]